MGRGSGKITGCKQGDRQERQYLVSYANGRIDLSAVANTSCRIRADDWPAKLEP